MPVVERFVRGREGLTHGPCRADLPAPVAFFSRSGAGVGKNVAGDRREGPVPLAAARD